MRFRRKMLVSLLLGTGCLMMIVASIQAQKNSNWEYFLATMQPERVVKGQDVEGTELTIVEGGRSLKLKITHVELDPQDPEQETYLYTLLYHNPVSEQWQNYCQPDRNNVAKAIPLSGYWDETGTHIEGEQITFACTNGVLAKCVRFGYKPWKTVQGRSLRPYHQSCTRMLRADYCGNGIAHTREGTLVDVYDRLKIQQPTPNSGMTFEAAWSPAGAVWLSRTRYPNAIAQLQRECPQKLKAILHPNQDALNTPQALLFNQSRNLQ